MANSQADRYDQLSGTVLRFNAPSAFTGSTGLAALGVPGLYGEYMKGRGALPGVGNSSGT